MDSLFYCSMRKSRLRNVGPVVEGSAYYNQVISKSPYFLNGKYVTKKNYLLYRTNKGLTLRASARCRQKDGDFCIQSLQPCIGFLYIFA